MLRQLLRQRGDTIIEVIFAFAATALLIVITYSIMNRSLAQIQMASEVTFVRQALDGEAEALRFLRNEYQHSSDKVNPPVGSYAHLWKTITTTGASGYLKSSASTFGTCVPAAVDKPFFVRGISPSDPDGDSVGVQNLTLSPYTAPADTYAQVGRGIWVEAVQDVTGSGAKYVDLHIRACWNPPFASSQPATIGTIVRQFYD